MKKARLDYKYVATRVGDGRFLIDRDDGKNKYTFYIGTIENERLNIMNRDTLILIEEGSRIYRECLFAINRLIQEEDGWN